MAEIKAVEIEVGGVTLRLSPDEARDLLAKLQGLLGAPAQIPYWPIYVEPARPWWQSPVTYGGGTVDPNPPSWWTITVGMVSS